MKKELETHLEYNIDFIALSSKITNLLTSYKQHNVGFICRSNNIKLFSFTLDNKIANYDLQFEVAEYKNRTNCGKIITQFWNNDSGESDEAIITIASYVDESIILNEYKKQIDKIVERLVKLERLKTS